MTLLPLDLNSILAMSGSSQGVIIVFLAIRCIHYLWLCCVEENCAQYVTCLKYMATVVNWKCFFLMVCREKSCLLFSLLVFFVFWKWILRYLCFFGKTADSWRNEGGQWESYVPWEYDSLICSSMSEYVCLAGIHLWRPMSFIVDGR